MSGQKFLNFGAHYDKYPCNYLTAAAAIGMTTTDVDLFINRLDQVLKKSNKTSIPKQLDAKTYSSVSPSTDTSSEKHDTSAAARKDDSGVKPSAVKGSSGVKTQSSTTAPPKLGQRAVSKDDDILKLGEDISHLKSAMGHGRKVKQDSLIKGSHDERGDKSTSDEGHCSEDDELLVV